MTTPDLPEAFRSRVRQSSRPRRWIWLAPDLQAARAYQREGQLTLPGYLRSIRGPWIFALWEPRDLRMYPSLVRGFFAFWWGWLSARIRRLRRRAAAQTNGARE